ncbi:MAG: hypothetical protein DWB44_07365 [Chloroflexi bacterium]|nr:hypothetical protein [Chloroflexota bacterium]GIK28270.1 MAG: hypothetical protein BroJett007_14080 [Chloroflexota bacterium]
MRDFSRSVMRHYGHFTEDAQPDAAVPAPRWSAGLQNPTPSAPSPSLQRVPVDFATDTTGYGQPPLLPIDPITPNPSPTAPVPEYVPREVFVAQPRSEATVQRAEADDTADETSPSHTLPTEYQGRAIPVDARPVDPAIKRHMQLTRQREAKVVQNREQRLDRLLSEVPEPPAPDETASHSGRRIRPRGHIGVEYVQTKALADKREPTDHAPSFASEPTPREPEPKPESTQRSVSTDDDEVSSTAADAAGRDISAVQRAVETAEASTAQTQPPSDSTSVTDGSANTPPNATPSANPSIQRSVSVEEALAFDDEPAASEPDRLRSSGETAPAPVQRAPDAVMRAPLDDMTPPDAPERPSEAPSEPREANSTGPAGEATASHSPSIQRAPAEPDSSTLPFDAPRTASAQVTDVQLSAETSAIQRHDEPDSPPPPPGQAKRTPDVPAGPGSSRPTVQRTPDRDESVPSTPGGQAARVDSPPAQSPTVQRSTDAHDSQPLTVQRAPDATLATPFDAPEVAHSAESPAPAQRAAEDSAPAMPSSDSQPAAMPTVQRAPDATPAIPFDAPETSHSAEAPAPVQRAAEDSSPAAPLSDSQPATMPTVQRAPDTTPAIPFDAPETSPSVETPAPVSRAAEDSAPAMPPSDSQPAAMPTVQRAPDTTPAIPFAAPEVAHNAEAPAPVQRAAEDSAPAMPPSDSQPAAMPTVQRAPDTTPAIPFDAPETSHSAEAPAPVQRAAEDSSPAATLSDSQPAAMLTVQRALDATPAIPFDAPETSHSAEAPTPVQRAAEDSAPAMPQSDSQPAAMPAIPFDAPETSHSAEAPAPVQRAAEDSAPAAPPSDSQPAAMPTVQRAPDTTPAIPFDAPEVAHSAETPAPVQRAAEDSSPAAPPSDSQPAAMPTVQRAPDTTPAIPFAAPEVAHNAEAPAPVQRAVEDSAPAMPLSDSQPATMPTVQRAPDTTPAIPFDAPETSHSAETPAPVQRAAEDSSPAMPPSDSQPAAMPTVQRAPDAAPAIPFDAPETSHSAETPAPVQRAAEDSSPAMPPSDSQSAAMPTVQRAPDATPAIPFDAPETSHSAEAPAPVQRVADEHLAPAMPLSDSQPAAMPTVQRVPDTTPAIPFDAPETSPSVETPAPVQRTPDEHSAEIVSPSAAPDRAVQRVSEPVSADGPVSASEAGTALPLPFDDVPAPIEPSAPQTSTGSVQRQTDQVDGRVFAVSSPYPAINRPDAHPIRRPKRIDRSARDEGRRDSVQRAADQPGAELTPSLPFDPIERPRPPEPRAQRMPDMPSPANPYAGMDLRQAMIAAGMIAPPPAPSPAAASSEGPRVQRDIDTNSQGTDTTPDPSSQDDATDGELNIDQLADDVMRVLRRRLRNEIDRSTGSNR